MRTQARAGLVRHDAALVLVVGLVCPAWAAPIQPPSIRPPADSSRVDVAGGLLHVEADDAPLRELLEEIARVAGFTLVGQEIISERVTLQLESIRLDVGLQRLLGGYRYGVQYPSVRRGGGRPAVPTHLAIFGPVENTPAGFRDTPPVADDMGGELDRLRSLLVNAGDASVRAAAVDALTELPNPSGALGLLDIALADSDEDVRLAAVDALAILGAGELAVDVVVLLQISLRDQTASVREASIVALEELGLDTTATAQAVEALGMALSDVEPDLRELAIDSLWEIGDERSIELLGYAAVADSDPAIRERAMDLWEQLRGEEP